MCRASLEAALQHRYDQLLEAAEVTPAFENKASPPALLGRCALRKAVKSIMRDGLLKHLMLRHCRGVPVG